nr:MAG TPA: hypothetical protein [Caudoviricetes sp.]
MAGKFTRSQERTRAGRVLSYPITKTPENTCLTVDEKQYLDRFSTVLILRTADGKPKGGTSQ